MQAMGSLCHEVAKLQADRAQLEELLAQVIHPHSPVYWPRLRLSCCSGMDACPAPIALQQTLAATSSAITPASDMHICWLTLQEAHRLQDVYAERDELQAHLDALDAEVTACTRVPGHDQRVQQRLQCGHSLLAGSYLQSLLTHWAC